MIMPGMDGNELVLWLAKRKSAARVIGDVPADVEIGGQALLTLSQ